MQQKSRAAADKAYQWRLTDLYPSDAVWEEEFLQAKAAAQGMAAFAGTLCASADALFAALTARSRVRFLLERLFVYAHMRRDEDNGNTRYQGMTDRAMQLSVAADAAIAYFEPEILGIPEETLRTWAQEARFAPFRFLLSDLDRQRAHVLGEKEERILAMAEEPLSGTENIFTMLSDVDLDFGTVKNDKGEEIRLTHGTYSTLLDSPDRTVRKAAYEAMYRAYRSMGNTVAATYATQVKADVFRARVRGYDGALEAALSGSNVPVAVYEQLIEAVHEKLPALTRYLELRKRKLGVEQLEMYDLYTPIVADCAMPMDYKEAQRVVREALAPLGADYQKLLDEAYGSGWIDVYENDGKTSGAFSWGAYGTHPYVLLNHQDDVDHAFTLAHELGHAMHSYFSNAALPYETANYTTMVAEVASTVNETLMMRHLLGKETDRKKRAYLLNQFLEQIRTTCFRQTMFAEFELAAHRMAENGEPLTVESLSAVYRALNARYYPGVHVDDNIAAEWMRIPHFYMPFYVYQYATGVCTAVALAREITENGAAERYRAFLSSGGSDYPIALLQRAGVDLTKKDSILSALDVFERSVAELEQILEEE